MYVAVKGEGSEVFLSAPIPWLFVSQPQTSQGGKFLSPTEGGLLLQRDILLPLSWEDVYLGC